MIEPLLNDLEESLSTHDRPVTVGFMLYELLSKAGYSDEDIAEVGHVIVDIVS